MIIYVKCLHAVETKFILIYVIFHSERGRLLVFVSLPNKPANYRRTKIYFETTNVNMMVSLSRTKLKHVESALHPSANVF